MGNSLDFALLFFAANVIGALPIPASPMLAPVEVTKLLHLSGSRFVAWDGVLALPGLEDVNLLSPDEIARLKRSPATSYADTAADDPA
jgi:acyl-CoA synthetase (AMP-forming)/AMP-acid ligase II